MAITITSLSPSNIADSGGEVVTIVGSGFPPGDIEVFVVDGAQLVPCYSGKSGSGLSGPIENDGSLSFVSPPLATGGPYAVLVRQGVDEDTLADALRVKNRNFGQKNFDMRQVWAPFWLTGPRGLDVSDPLAPDTLAIGTIADQAAIVGAPYSFTPTIANPTSSSVTWASVGTPLPSWAALDANTGEVSGTPAGGDVGITSGVRLRVTNGVSAYASSTFILTVTV